MINPFGFPSLLAVPAAPGAPMVYSSLGGTGKRLFGGGNAGSERRSVPLRKPILGEALIDSDGVVWLVESVQDRGDAGYTTSVARITKTEGDGQPTSVLNMSREEFATFCNSKGIQLRGGD
jgi:hypothetical protein